MQKHQVAVINTLKRELTRLNKAAEKAKALVDEYTNCHLEIMAVRQAAQAIISNPNHSHEQRAKLIEPLAAREKRAINISKKDLTKLIQKQAAAEIAHEDMAREISLLELRYSR